MRAYCILLAVLLSTFLVGCGSDAKPGGADNAAPPPPPRGASAPRSDADAGTDGGRKAEFQEQDFVETERNRDPFRSFAATFSGASARMPTKQREVMLDRYSIDELKLVGIVTGGAEHRAMLIDPTGKGWIVKRGQFVGREEVVHGKGATGADYALNWRVDRIRDGDLVLVREDPAHSDVPPATRVIPLRPDSETASSKH
jgi:type IV pilus assembly protein PilP